MRRLSPASLLIAALLALGLPACGSASPPDRQGGRVSTSDRTAPADAPGRAGGGVALKKIGQFESPVFVTGAPGYPKLLFVVEQPGRVAVLSGGKRLSRPFLDLR